MLLQRPFYKFDILGKHGRLLVLLVLLNMITVIGHVNGYNYIYYNWNLQFILLNEGSQINSVLPFFQLQVPLTPAWRTRCRVR